MTARTLPALLAARVAATPQAPAFLERDATGQWQPLSWQGFHDQVQQLRRRLHAAGLRPGDRLALMAPASLQWEVVHHAALAAGAVVVGLDGHDLPERLADMVEQADIAAFVVADTAPLSCVAPQRLAGARFVWTLGQDTLPPPADGAVLPGHVSGDDLATIIFTSGTTGRPRGIAYTHDQVCLATRAICAHFPFVDRTSRLLCWLPLSNLFQRIVNLAAVQQGAATWVLADPRQVMDVVAQVSPDIFVGVPRFFEKLHEGIRDGVAAQPALRRWLARQAWDIGRRMSRCTLQGRRPSPALRLQHALADRLVLRRLRALMGQRLRLMVTGSAPIGQHLLQEFHALGWLVLEAYGLSENIVPMAMNRADDFCFGTVGRPVASNEVVVGDDGAVRVRGPGLFHGYLGEAGAPLDDQGYYVTGDLGAWDEHGHLRLIGRSSELFKTSTGRRISPVQVEAALREVPGIDQALLVGAGRKVPVALCTLADATLGADARQALAQALAARVAQLPAHEQPRAVRLLARPFGIAEGELTPNLKLRRSAIEARHADEIEALYRRVDAAGRDGPLLVV